MINPPIIYEICLEVIQIRHGSKFQPYEILKSFPKQKSLSGTPTSEDPWRDEGTEFKSCLQQKSRKQVMEFYDQDGFLLERLGALECWLRNGWLQFCLTATLSNERTCHWTCSPKDKDNFLEKAKLFDNLF